LSIEICSKCNSFHSKEIPCPKPIEENIPETSIDESQHNFDPEETKADLELGTTSELIQLMKIINQILIGRKSK